MIQLDEIKKIYSNSLLNLIRQAISTHEKNFPENKIQASTLYSLKTGGCPENCSYCSQSAHYKTNLKKQPMAEIDDVLEKAILAKEQGASRFCMGAAWREVKEGKEFDQVLELIKKIKLLNLEVCCTLGMLKFEQAQKLKEAGLDFYNHNLDTSPNFYSKVIQTRTFQDRIETIQNVRRAGVSVCTGGILGLGESDDDRIELVYELVNLSPQPESLTVNLLVPMAGTPLENNKPIEPLDLIRFIACLRILAPRSMIRLSAGRMSLSKESQVLCFLCGANSIFLGEKLLTSNNGTASEDLAFIEKIGATL